MHKTLKHININRINLSRGPFWRICTNLPHACIWSWCGLHYGICTSIVIPCACARGKAIHCFCGRCCGYKNCHISRSIAIIRHTKRHLPVFGTRRARVFNSDNDEYMLELWPNTARRKGLTAWILEYHCYYIIANVTFSE